MKRGDMETLLLIPLDDTIVFPGMSATLALEVGEDSRVLLVPRAGGEFAAVGTVAEVVEKMRIPGGATAVTVQGLHRGVPGVAKTPRAGPRGVGAVPRGEEDPGDRLPRVAARESRAVIE